MIKSKIKVNEMKILIGLHRVTNYIDRQSMKIFAQYDLTMGQFGVLEALYHKGDMTIGQVQDKILSSSGTIPLIINNLEKRKYLVREIDKNDKRRCILHITEAGKNLISEVYPQNETTILETMEAWSEEDKKMLLGLLKKLEVK